MAVQCLSMLLDRGGDGMALFYGSIDTLTLVVCNGGTVNVLNYRIRDDYLLDGSFVDVVVAINVNKDSYLLVDGEHLSIAVGADWAGGDGYKFLQGGSGTCSASATAVAFASGEFDLDVGWQVYYNRSHTPVIPENLGMTMLRAVDCRSHCVTLLFF